MSTPTVPSLQSVRAVKGDATAIGMILKAVVKTKGNMQKAGVELGISKSSLYRIIGELEAWDEIDKLAQKKGFPMRRGRARTQKPK